MSPITIAGAYVLGILWGLFTDIIRRALRRRRYAEIRATLERLQGWGGA